MMKKTSIDGMLLSKMFQAAEQQLGKYVKQVDALNVFPVPDGDTGTNMSLSIRSGIQQMGQVNSEHLGEVAKALSKGLLMGARGNSGVILSQLFRGFAKLIEDEPAIDSIQFAAALQHGVEIAYKSVIKPVEGTILTVAKDASRVAAEQAQSHDDIIEVMSAVLVEAKQSLQRTPDLLPILKQVGVIDSGGQGLVYVYEGMLSALKGVAVQVDVASAKMTMSENKEAHVHDEVAMMMQAGVLSVDDITYGYCTEFMIKLDEQKTASFDESLFREKMNRLGDSLLVISDDELVKVHIHAEDLSKVMSLAQGYGGLVNIKIENMREQFNALKEDNKAKKIAVTEENEINVDTVPQFAGIEKRKYGIVTVAMGEGVIKIFKSIGADVVISGGQTMNPSTADFVSAINRLNVEQIIILPNNSNIILAAEQAADISDISVKVIPTQNIPQGINALLRYRPELPIEQNEATMKASIEELKVGYVTIAVRDTRIEDITISKGDFMGMSDGSIVVTDQKATAAACALLKHLVDDDAELITLITGADAKSEEIEQINQFVEAAFPFVDIEVHTGGQPLYPYIVSVE